MLPLFRLPGGVAAAILAVLLFQTSNVVATHSINVDMKAAFPSPPYLLELLESAAEENATSYFPILDRVASGYFAQAKSDEALYEKFLELLQIDGHMTDPESLSTFKLALSLRSSTPRIEAHYQYYHTAVESLSTEKDACADWILSGGNKYCSAALTKSESAISGESQLRSLPFDRSLGKGPDVVLYADITAPNFGSLHRPLMNLARNGERTYRLRYRAGTGNAGDGLAVSGYGVELQLKRTDYIVIDDREGEPKTGDKKSAPIELGLDNEEDVADLKPLSTSDLSSLGVKAASYIMQSEAPFQALVKLTQDFPKHSTSISGHNVSAKFLAEHKANRGMVPAGMNVLWMNGVQLIERQIEPYSLVDLLRRERNFIKGVTSLGLTGKQAVSLLGYKDIASAKTDQEESRRFDWRDDNEENKVIIWMNNIEKDSRYHDFSQNLMSVLQRTYPGQLPSIRKNIFNLIVPVDLTKSDDLEVVVEQLLGFVKRRLPIRFGLVPLVSSKKAEEHALVSYYLLESYGLAAFVAYLDVIKSGKKPTNAEQGALDKAVKDRIIRADATPLSLSEILASDLYAKRLSHAKTWLERLNADSAVPPVFINGIVVPRQGNWLQAMSTKLTQDLQLIQQGVFTGEIDDDASISDLLLEGAPKRRNAYIYPDSANPLTVLNVDKIYAEHDDLFTNLPLVEASPDASKETWATLTLVADMTTNSGQRLLLSALEFRRNNPGVRLDVITNTKSPLHGSRLNNVLVKESKRLVEIENLEIIEVLLATAGDEAATPGYDLALGRFLAAAGLKAGAQALLLNGRLVGPLKSEDTFKAEDFEVLLDFEQAARLLPVYKAIESLDLGAQVRDALSAARITSITALSTISDLPEGIFESAPTLRATIFDDWQSEHTMISVGDEARATIHLVAVINPASEQGQKWASLLKVLSELEGIYLRVFLNPRENLDELPVKRFYRYVLDSSPSFSADGKVLPMGAKFKGIPSEALLNLGMDVPPAWLVAAQSSVHDLDNLKLSSVKTDVYATYKLENILIEGHSREGKNSPPRGVQLLLGTERDAHFADTIIMANIGYFQFKANPGYYNIRLKEGRSTDIYTIESVGAKGFSPIPGDDGTDVALMDFKGTTLYPRLQRKPGQETADVLEDSGAGSAGDLLSKGLKFAGSLLGSKKAKSASAEAHADINIFSVASGHLYERMLNIMMVSVMRHTNHTVKFWFIEQFLSPSFKEFIPQLAAEYGFKYEMVTYKWPHWLRGQKEKQREIWGYKILFLDVLFPLSLDKVIFVDADQIVRTDMMELVNLDLEGAPYGFTPMCDSRTEMEGFRFWKQGYWKNYLRDLPYHISALYVVDLQKFRELAAGDRLRQTYHSLSADPASLSNLDQDLPNHMQMQIPIHSLPQEWLWCETWCSDESLKEAKTIDLCNNPQTKEPKLDRARRQVPEWTVYDDEIAALARRNKSSAMLVNGEDQSQHIFDEKTNDGQKSAERRKDEL